MEEPAVKAAFKALEDDKDLDILAYIQKIDASTSSGTSAAKQDDEQVKDQDADGKAESSSTDDTAKDSLETKIKKLGMTEKLPETFKDAYLSAKQKQLDAECEEIMKDKEVLEVIKALETDPVSFESLPLPRLGLITLVLVRSTRGRSGVAVTTSNAVPNGFTCIDAHRMSPHLLMLLVYTCRQASVEEKIRGDKNLEKKLMTLVHGGVLQPPGQEPPPGMGGGMPPGMMGGGMPPGMMGGGMPPGMMGGGMPPGMMGGGMPPGMMGGMPPGMMGGGGRPAPPPGMRGNGGGPE